MTILLSEDQIYEGIDFSMGILESAEYDSCRFSVSGLAGLLGKYDIEIEM